MKGLIASIFLTLPASAQILGAFNPFSNEETATSWGFYDFGEPDSTYAPFWTYPGSDDAEIYTTFEVYPNPETNEDEAFEVSLFADELSSDGAFVNDYDAVGIDTVRSDVFVEDVNTFDELEFYFRSGETDYYSEIFELEESGWAQIESSFTKDEWYLFDSDLGEFFPVELTPVILSDIREIGVTFYPSGLGAQGRVVALDNFTLLPDLAVPQLAIKNQNGGPRLTFTGIPGMQYTLEGNRSLRKQGWTNLRPPFEVTGPSQTPVPSRKRAFFRLISRPFFVEIP
mgnify:CR=1 FL=1